MLLAKCAGLGSGFGGGFLRQSLLQRYGSVGAGEAGGAVGTCIRYRM